MANLNLLDGIMWRVYEPIEEADLHHGYNEIAWDEVILPADNFIIEYLIVSLNPDDEEGAEVEKFLSIPYETDGQPVTVRDLMTTIYNFYQEPVDPKDGPYGEEVVTKGDTIYGWAKLEDFKPVGLNRYRLITQP